MIRRRIPHIKLHFIVCPFLEPFAGSKKPIHQIDLGTFPWQTDHLVCVLSVRRGVTSRTFPRFKVPTYLVPSVGGGSRLEKEGVMIALMMPNNIQAVMKIDSLTTTLGNSGQDVESVSCWAGWVNIEVTSGPTRRIKYQRIHWNNPSRKSRSI